MDADNKGPGLAMGVVLLVIVGLVITVPAAIWTVIGVAILQSVLP